MPVHREVEEVFPCSEHDPQIKSEQPFDVSVHARDTNAINPYYVNNSYLHPGGGGPRQMEGASLQADSSGRRSWDVTEVNEVAEQLNQCPSQSRTRITSAPSSSRSTPGRTHLLGKRQELQQLLMDQTTGNSSPLGLKQCIQASFILRHNNSFLRGRIIHLIKDRCIHPYMVTRFGSSSWVIIKNHITIDFIHQFHLLCNIIIYLNKKRCTHLVMLTIICI